MTRKGPVLLFVVTIFISSLPRERYTVKSCGVLPFQCNPPCLFISTTTEIVALDFDNVTSHQVITGILRAVAIDVHFNLGYIFWSDVTEKKIKRSCIDGTNITIINENSGVCDGLAVQWKSSQLYWTDTTNDRISVSDLEGNNTRILVSVSLDEPRGIVLDPELGLMFWTDWGRTPKIERSTLNGTQRVTLATSNLQWPNGITLDRQNRLVFWADAGVDRVESIDYHGNNRKLLYQQDGYHFFGVAFLSPYLFVTEWETKGVFKLNASSGAIKGNVYFNGVDKLMGLVRYDSSWQLPVNTCPALPAPSNGTRLGCPGNATMFYDTVCQFSCNDGYIGSGSQVRRCQHNGTWSGQDFTCDVDGCKHYKVLNGVDRAQGNTFPPHQRCDSNLEPGWYRFQGAAGDRMADTCVSMLRCGTVAPGWLSGVHPTIVDGVVVRKVCYNWLACCGRSDNIKVQNCGCFFVYELKKPPSCNFRYCGNGSAEYRCPALHAPPNGIKFGCPGNATMYYDTVCQFSCNDGYIGSGSQQRRCQRNGTWSGEVFTCQMITCPALPAPSNGTRLGCPQNATMYYDNVCQFSCNDGYIGSGSQARRCQYNGTWSGQDFTCQMITCPALPVPSNGTRLGCPQNATMYYDTVCQFSCNDGYIGSGSQARRCQHNGTWSGQDFTCQIVTCLALPSPPNSLRYGCTGNASEYPYDTVCRFSCIAGYNAIGSSVRRCQQNGLWSGGEFSCQAVTCPTLSPPTNGELLGCNTTEMLYNTVCRFSCNEGYEAKGSMVRRCTENGTWSGTNLVCTVDITRNTSAFVNVTEGERITINCSIPGTDKPSWSRRDGKELITKTRKVEGVLLQIANISVADTGIYVCKHGKDTHTIWIQVLVKLDVEMELVVENYEFTEELKDKSSPVYKETEKNFTTEMDKVHKGVTPGYLRTEVLNFTKGSVKVDFRIIIVLVTNDPENATDLPDVKAKTAQRVVVKAKSGFVERLQVKKVIVKTVPLEPANVEIFGIDSDELSVRWSPSEDADSFEVLKYVVQHREFSDKVYTSASQPASDDKTQYTFRIQPLEPETIYMVRVGAVNKYGENYNDESTHTTEPTPFAWWIIVVVVLVILLVLVILVVLILYKRKRDRERREQQQGPRLNALELDARSNAVAVYEDKNVKGLVYSYSNDAYKPSEMNWEEIPYHNLKLLDELGSGAFGVVYKGELLQDNGNVMPCAVKALKPSATSEEIRDLYNELEIMVNVGYHPNLVNLIGACTEDGHLLVVLEIAENGSLLEFLKKSRPTDQSYENINSGLTEEMKTRIATDVARGMAHLANYRCIHRDLAARNVLLGKDYVAKVSDYGMARDVYEQLMYKKETQGKLPVKWMAIESLETYIFTIESDVWAYGVLLWEIESGGLKPYAGLNTTELIAQLKKGYRLEKPNGCSEEMYQIMRSCWNPNPSARPTFGQLLIQMQSKTET